MSDTFTDIKAALNTQLNAMTGKPPIAWQNYGYEPIKGTLYIRPTDLSGDFEQVTLGAGGQDQVTSIYQVDIFAPSGEGSGTSTAMAELIANQFKRGAYPAYGGVILRIKSVSPPKEGVNEDTGWYHTFIEITYTAITDART